MLVLIGKPSQSTFIWVPMCQGFRDFSEFLHYFVLVATLPAAALGLTHHMNTTYRFIRCSSGFAWDLKYKFHLTLMLLVANLANTKWCKNLENDWNPGIWVLIWKHSSRAIQWIPTWQGLDGFKGFCVLVLWTKVAAALEGLTWQYRQLCLIPTDVAPKSLSGLGKTWIMHIGVICIERDRDLPICPV